MRKRVFVGIEVSDKLSKFLENWIKNNPWVFASGFRLIKPKDLHLTLLPPWYESDIKRLIIVGEKLSLKPFKLGFDTISVGPYKNPRLIWLKGQANYDLLTLKSLLEKSFNRPCMSKEFVPHITFVRFRRGVEYKKINKEVTVEENICSFSIFESKLSSKGASYKVIKTFEFRG